LIHVDKFPVFVKGLPNWPAFQEIVVVNLVKIYCI
jgi:hypothetical protein